MKEEYSRTIINKELFFKMVEDKIKDNSLEEYVNGICFDTSIPFARFFVDKKLLCFNYYNIIKTFFNKFKNQFNVKEELIEFINLNILVIINHEIEHVIQEKNMNEIISYSLYYENKLKRDGNYSLEKYVNNPVERQANIYSYEQLLKEMDICSEQCMKKNKIKIFFYFTIWICL